MSGPGGAPEKPSGGRRFGKYLLHDRLAVGGMGELFLATEVGAARGTPPCVLKILLPEYGTDAEFVSMFHDEARIGLQLRHPNIVGVYDLGRVGDTPYLTLEYVHGENLRTVLNRVQDKGERFPVEHAAYIVIEALNGLSYAHQVKDGRGRPLNLVHRDLSPDNIMVTFDGDVKVLDFGIAKAEGRATQTQFGILKGKVQYMSPEQALGSAVDARTDVYAMGLVLLEVLTGERRFENVVDPVQMIRDARTWTPKTPSSQNPEIPAEVDGAILRSLQSAVDKRFQSAEEYAAALIRLRRSGLLPRPKESLPTLLRRLFPDRAEPFLQIEPSYRKGPESDRTSTSDLGMKGPIPDENEILGAFLARGPSDSNPRVVSERTRESEPRDSTVVGARQPDTTEPGARGISGETVASAPLSDPTMESRLGAGDRPMTGSISNTRVAIQPPPPEDTAPGVRDAASTRMPEATVVEPRRERSREVPAAQKREVSRDGIPAARREVSREGIPAAQKREVSRDGIPAAKKKEPTRDDIRAAVRKEASRDGLPAARKKVVQEAPPADETTASGGAPVPHSGVTPLPAERGGGAGAIFLVAALILAGAAGFALVAFEDRLPPGIRARLAAVTGGKPVPAATQAAGALPIATATPAATAASDANPEANPEEAAEATPESEATPEADATPEATATIVPRTTP